MRDYSKVSASFWTRGSGKRLRGNADAQVLALYLVTCPASNMVGVYYVPLVAVAHETGLGLERATHAMRCLEASGFAYYDPEAELVWVPNMAGYQIGEELKEGDKRRGGPIRAELDKIGRHPFVHAFWIRYGAGYGLGPVPADLSTMVPPGPPIGPSSPYEAPPKGDTPHSGRAGAGAGEEQEKNRSIGASGQAGAPTTLPGIDPSETESANGKVKATPVGMSPDWQPTPEHVENVRAKGLHLGRVLADFRQHWIDEKTRKSPANWNKTFASNIRRICDTDWLTEKFRLSEAEIARASWPVLDDPGAAGSENVTDAEAQAALDAAIAELQARSTTAILREVEAEDAVGSSVRLVFPGAAQ